MEKTKTAMMQLRDDLKAEILLNPVPGGFMIESIIDAIEKKYLAIEQEQLKQAYWGGVVDLGNDNVGFEEYYNEKYEN